MKIMEMVYNIIFIGKGHDIILIQAKQPLLFQFMLHDHFTSLLENAFIQLCTYYMWPCRQLGIATVWTAERSAFEFR
jgi:hypothetical protein